MKLVKCCGTCKHKGYFVLEELVDHIGSQDEVLCLAADKLITKYKMNEPCDKYLEDKRLMQ